MVVSCKPQSEVTTDKNYDFGYEIAVEETMDEKSHTESRVDDIIRGRYTILQPDGVMRTVTYQTFENGTIDMHVEYEKVSDPIPQLVQYVVQDEAATRK